MNAFTEPTQRIAALTPLGKVLSRLDALSPVTASARAPEAALGAVLAADLIAPADLPAAVAALTDGWAVVSEETGDASSYAPVRPASVPNWVNAGDPMPAGPDAVLPADAVNMTSDAPEIIASAARGEGVLPAQFHAAMGAVLRRAGERLRKIDVAAAITLSIPLVMVRAPRVKIISMSQPKAVLDSVTPMIAEAVRNAGGVPDCASTFDALGDGADWDAVFMIGGTGSGNNDRAVTALRGIGRIDFHGLGIAPGRTAGYGSLRGTPVLMLPGRLDAALAVFVLVGSALIAKLSGAAECDDVLVRAPLERKINSTIGMTEVVFARRGAGGIEPLGAGLFSLQALMQAEGWIYVPPESEGFPAGAHVEMKALP